MQALFIRQAKMSGKGKSMAGKGGGKDGAGRALMRRQKQSQTGPGGGSGAAPAMTRLERAQLNSVLEMNSLDDFLSTALMAQREFAAVKERDLIILDSHTGQSTTMATAMARPNPRRFDFRQLKVSTILSQVQLVLDWAATEWNKCPVIAGSSKACLASGHECG
jgi:hypothetical protein